MFTVCFLSSVVRCQPLSRALTGRAQLGIFHQIRTHVQLLINSFKSKLLSNLPFIDRNCEINRKNTGFIYCPN
ncbi:hypothetical protein DD610_13040 [Vibrio anguillarum]|nr:hypothetical protein DD610_13040 [Vibrio anguillarum]